MEITREQLAQIIPKNPYIDQWCSALNKLLPDYGIDTPQRVAAFLAPNKAEAIANRIYANRMGNGDEASGDGFRYCGRGLIQLTGKSNYSNFADSIETAVEETSAYLETFEGAVQSACWFWETNNLNQYADSNDILTMTKRINGGTIGLDDRIKHYNHALHVFGGH
jgi:putative chitinase